MRAILVVLLVGLIISFVIGVLLRHHLERQVTYIGLLDQETATPVSLAFRNVEMGP